MNHIILLKGLEKNNIMISINDVSVYFGGKPLFENINFVISQKEKIALVGKNGVGKSTLLKLISGKENPTKGSISKPNNINIGYLPQVILLDKEDTIRNLCYSVFEDVISIEKAIERTLKELCDYKDYNSDEYIEIVNKLSQLQDKLNINPRQNYNELIEKTLIGLGFNREDFDKHSSSFSGGWRMRIELAKLLLSEPDILLLDEPTNHLDIESIQWLEKHLITSNVALILISHDKRFIDATTERTIEIDLGKLYDYKTNYSHYINLRKERIEQQQRAFENQQKEIKETENFIDKFRYKATKATQVQSRIKKLNKIERISIDNIDNRKINFKFSSIRSSGKYPIIVKNLSKSYGKNNIFSNINLTIERGNKVAIIGKNGSGKSTFIKCLMNEIVDFSGTITIGHNVDIGYFAQNQVNKLDPKLTIFETIDRVAIGEIRSQINNILGAFMFAGETSGKKIEVLSGGERSRIALIRLLLKPANLLILDEPTNHLDIDSKDVLKKALLQFEGTVIIVSHDRDFLDGLVSEVFEFRDNTIHHYLGEINNWIESKESPKDKICKKQTLKSNKELDIELKSSSYKRQKEIEKNKKRILNKIKLLEHEISLLEQNIKNMEIELANQNSLDDSFFKNYQETQNKLSEKIYEWEYSYKKLQNHMITQ